MTLDEFLKLPGAKVHGGGSEQITQARYVQTLCKVADSLNERAMLVLMGMKFGRALTLNEIISLARKETDKKAMSFKLTAKPLLEKNLLREVRPVKIIKGTTNFEPALYSLTDRGRDVAHIIAYRKVQP